MTKRYVCPTCGKLLTKAEHDAALQLTEAQEAQHAAEVAAAKKQGIAAERARIATLTRRISHLEEVNRQLRRGQTPQTAGLDDQHKMAARLQREFEPLGDKVIEKGQGGDVLHHVVYEDKNAGLIVYECKSSPDPGKRIPSADIRQAADAKEARGANFAVLVTTGRRKDFGGYIQVDGVLICGPLCAIPLAELLRLHLVEMAKANLTRKQRAQVAQGLLVYITSPEFQNRIRDAAQSIRTLEGVLDKEMQTHFKVWEDRSYLYQRIQWDLTQIQANIALVMAGKEPQASPLPKRGQLQLPAPAELVL